MNKISKQFSIRIRDDVYEVLNRERGHFTMSAFINDLLYTYAEMVIENTEEHEAAEGV